MKYNYFLSVVLIILMAVVFSGCGKSDIYTPPTIDLPAIEPPTSDNPLIFYKEFEVKRNNSGTFEVGFYNKRTSDLEAVKLSIEMCKNIEGEDMSVPKLASIAQNVKSNEAIGYKIIIDLKENADYTPGVYVCNMLVHSEHDIAKIYEKKSFYLEVMN